MNTHYIDAMPIRVASSADTCIAETVGAPHLEYGVGVTEAAAIDDLLACVLEAARGLEGIALGPLMEEHREYLERYVRYWWVTTCPDSK